MGAPVAGRISDYIVVHYRASRGGIWYPEDRLRVSLIGAGILVPLSILFSGLLTQYAPLMEEEWGIRRQWGLAANLVCLFFNGVGVDFVMSPSGAYAVDILRDRSVESTAATK